MADGAFRRLGYGRGARQVLAKVDGRKAARRSRQQKTADAVDGRSLRATGRTQHLVQGNSADQEGLGERTYPRARPALWLEEAIIEKLQRQGIDLDA